MSKTVRHELDEALEKLKRDRSEEIEMVRMLEIYELLRAAGKSHWALLAAEIVTQAVRLTPDRSAKRVDLPDEDGMPTR